MHELDPVSCSLVVSAIFLVVIMIPISQWIDYRKLVKKYGKEIADEIVRRY